MWNNEVELNFIEVYQAEPILWDPTHRLSKDKNMRDLAWERLREQTGIPVPELKRKKDSLMATYRAHTRKMKKCVESGAEPDQVHKPIWFAFDAMHSFLKHLYDINSTTNIEYQKVPLDDAWEKTESGDDENFKTEIADTSTTTTSNKRQRTYSPDLQPSPCSMNQGNAERIDFFESEMSRVHNQSQGFEDQYDMFGRHVAGQLRELPLRSFVILQEKIQRLITKERLLSMGMEAL